MIVKLDQLAVRNASSLPPGARRGLLEATPWVRRSVLQTSTTSSTQVDYSVTLAFTPSETHPDTMTAALDQGLTSAFTPPPEGGATPFDEAMSDAAEDYGYKNNATLDSSATMSAMQSGSHTKNKVLIYVSRNPTQLPTSMPTEPPAGFGIISVTTIQTVATVAAVAVGAAVGTRSDAVYTGIMSSHITI